MDKRIFLLDEITPVEMTLREGQGKGLNRRFFGPEEAPAGGPFKMAAVNVMPPGVSIGYHKHEGDAEVFIVISGRGSYIDDAGKKTTLKAGDMAFCCSGEKHGFVNDGDEPLCMAGIIAR